MDDGKEIIKVNNVFAPVYYPYLENYNKRYLVMIGGGGSGKSYFAGQKIIYRMLKEKNHKILVTRKVDRTLRHSTFDLLKDVVNMFRCDQYFNYNKTEMGITCNLTNSQIIHKGLDDVEKIKSIQGLTSIWIEEATEITKQDFMQLDIRLRGEMPYYKQIILSFNPIDITHWLYDYFFANPSDRIKSNTSVIHTTYKDNPYLDQEYKEVLEGLIEQDVNYYNIYALGNWGILTGLIYKTFIIIENYPNSFEETFYGLDFGYNNPTALIQINIKDNNLYIKELLYRTKLTNSDLIDAIKDMNIPKYANIYADSAEPQRIEELCRAGFNVMPAHKSVKDGIDFVKRFKIYTNRENVNLNKENKAYSYKRNKNGETIDEPIKMNDHCLDAMRYGIFTHLKDRFIDNKDKKTIMLLDEVNLRNMAEAFMEMKYEYIKENKLANYLDAIAKRLNLKDTEAKQLEQYVKEHYNY